MLRGLCAYKRQNLTRIKGEVYLFLKMSRCQRQMTAYKL